MNKERLVELAGLEPHRMPPLREYPDDIISMDVPLLIKMLEWAREHATTDEQLHKVAEKLVSLSPSGTVLSMKDYESIIRDVMDITPPEQPSGSTGVKGIDDKQYRTSNMVKSVPVKTDVLNVAPGTNLGA